MEEFCDTVARLRAPDGCPWDRAQTHETLKAACIEEAAEVICGINILAETGRAECLCEELGDLLLQVVMHAQIAEEEGLFTLNDVIRTINDKMIRRHPHVFGCGNSPALQSNSALHAFQDLRAGTGAEQAESLRPENQPEDEDIEDIPKTWKQIKALEKKGREWEKPYLFAAFGEAEQLIDVARKRKQGDDRQIGAAKSRGTESEDE